MFLIFIIKIKDCQWKHRQGWAPSPLSWKAKCLPSQSEIPRHLTNQGSLSAGLEGGRGPFCGGRCSIRAVGTVCIKDICIALIDSVICYKEKKTEKMWVFKGQVLIRKHIYLGGKTLLFRDQQLLQKGFWMWVFQIPGKGSQRGDGQC